MAASSNAGPATRRRLKPDAPRRSPAQVLALRSAMLEFSLANPGLEQKQIAAHFGVSCGYARYMLWAARQDRRERRSVAEREPARAAAAPGFDAGTPGRPRVVQGWRY